MDRQSADALGLKRISARQLCLDATGSQEASRMVGGVDGLTWQRGSIALISHSAGGGRVSENSGLGCQRFCQGVPAREFNSSCRALWRGCGLCGLLTDQLSSRIGRHGRWNQRVE